jgi:hypothetical protein
MPCAALSEAKWLNARSCGSVKSSASSSPLLTLSSTFFSTTLTPRSFSLYSKKDSWGRDQLTILRHSPRAKKRAPAPILKRYDSHWFINPSYKKHPHLIHSLFFFLNFLFFHWLLLVEESVLRRMMKDNCFYLITTELKFVNCLSRS